MLSVVRIKIKSLTALATVPLSKRKSKHINCSGILYQAKHRLL